MTSDLRTWSVGAARVKHAEGAYHFYVDPTTAGRYANAQCDDYSAGGKRGRGTFVWRPPVILQVRAQIAAGVVGTAGFGFWNNPFTPLGGLPALPDALWFFYAAPPNDMALVPGVPGWGWKAAQIHAQRWGALASGVPWAAASMWARLTGRRTRAARWLQRLTGAHERVLAVDAAEWHSYRLEWRRTGALWAVDGVEVLRVVEVPPGPLGFVAWVDTQYAVVRPDATLGGGTLAVTQTHGMTMIVEELRHG